jgi:hypothetical protein
MTASGGGRRTEFIAAGWLRLRRRIELDRESRPAIAPRLIASTLPPCASTSAFDKARPRPRPPNRRLIDSSAWPNCFEDLRQCFGFNPMPGIGDLDLQSTAVRRACAP